MLKMPNSFQMEALQATYGVQENGDSFVKKNQKGRSTGKAGFAQSTFDKESPAVGILYISKHTKQISLQKEDNSGAKSQE